MKYVKIFVDFRKSLDMLSDAEKGRLFSAMLEYAESGTEPDLKGNERFIWPTAKMNIDKTAESYERVSKANRENVTKRYEALRNSTKTYESYESYKEKDKEKEKDKDKDKYIPPKPPKGQTRFMKFWEEYPKKVGKGAAEKAFLKYKPDDNLTDQMISAVRKQKSSPQWLKDNGQFIPNPATWLNQRRWEDEEKASVSFANSLVSEFMEDI